MLASGVKPISKKEILALINEIEAKYPVYEWRHHGIDLWPLIRQIIFKHFLVKKVTTRKSSQKSVDIFDLLKFFFSNLLLEKNIIRTEVLFSANQAHRTQLAGLSFNRFADPLIDGLNDLGMSGSLIEQSKTDGFASDVYKLERFYELDNSLLWEDFKLRLYRKFKKNKFKLESYNIFIDEIVNLDKEIGGKLSVDKINKLAQRLIRYKRFATLLLRKIKPKAVIFICYYGEWQQALMVAAKDLQVPTFDIQHGIIYPEHYSYGKYNNIPKQGLNTLPDYFWTWGDYETRIINKWCYYTTHQAVSMGNPWLMAFKEGRTPYKDDISEWLNPEKKLILYTLGNRGDQLPLYLVNFIIANNQNFDIWFRLHPRQIPFRTEIEEQLKKHGIFEMVNLEQATHLPLPAILMHSSLHLTLMSSVVIEAAHFGVKSLIMHQDGYEYYKDHEVKDFCCFFDFSNQDFESVIINLIEEGKNGVKNKETFHTMTKKIVNLIEHGVVT